MVFPVTTSLFRRVACHFTATAKVIRCLTSTTTETNKNGAAELTMREPGAVVPIDIGTGTNSGKGKGQMGFTDWRMLKDARRRKVVQRDAIARLRLNALKRNTVLPKAVQELAYAELAAMPKDGSHVRLVSRCVITSRARGVVKSWRISRIMWRHLADYNYLSGVQRAMW